MKKKLSYDFFFKKSLPSATYSVFFKKFGIFQNKEEYQL